MSKIDQNSLPTDTFDWGQITWLVAPEHTEGAVMSAGEVVLMPGVGHDRHNHPDSEEILYVLSGEGLQVVDDDEPFPVHAGDCVYVPTAVYHSTLNTAWQPLRLLAIYNPGGSEAGLRELPDYCRVEAGQPPRLTRAK